MKLPSLSLHDFAFIALVAKMSIAGGSFAEAAVIIGLVASKAYTMFLEKKQSLLKADELEKRINGLESKLMATGLVRRTTNSNV